MKNFKVTIWRDGDWWAVAIPSLNGITRAERREDAERAARKYIATKLDIAESEILVVLYDVPAP